MKCSKCKQAEVIFDDEVVRMNKKGKIVFDHAVGYCPACDTRYEIDKLGTHGRPKRSDLSFIAFILSGLFVTAPLGIICAIIDLVKGESTQDHKLSVLAFLIGICCSCVLVSMISESIRSVL
ncbi:MAG: hypothetical protein HFJ06_01795 [Lachnospiraceae bacterium]|nr:hypothetical protein [Lachnospiraceae bacterium]